MPLGRKGLGKVATNYLCKEIVLVQLILIENLKVWVKLIFLTLKVTRVEEMQKSYQGLINLQNFIYLVNLCERLLTTQFYTSWQHSARLRDLDLLAICSRLLLNFSIFWMKKKIARTKNCAGSTKALISLKSSQVAKSQTKKSWVARTFCSLVLAKNYVKVCVFSKKLIDQNIIISMNKM